MPTYIVTPVEGCLDAPKRAKIGSKITRIHSETTGAPTYFAHGIHVAHVVIDGGIDGERLRSRQPESVRQRGEDGLLNIDAIAEAYWQIHRRRPSAWPQEIDLRPFKEAF
jgi:phenylpyruvate tautomerase PptA (4-oxalocrotonate tautomerase family)